MARNAIGMMTANANLVGESPCDATGVCVGVVVLAAVAAVGVMIWFGGGGTCEVVGTDAGSVTRSVGTAVSVEEGATWRKIPAGRA